MKIKIARLDNVIVGAFIVGVASFVLTGCGGSDSPTAPSAPAAAADGAGGVRQHAVPPSPPGNDGYAPATPASFDADGLRPDASGFNAYDFEASWDGSMLRLALIEDRMRDMREASKPHRNRMITVMHCPVEPHHALQSCGEPIWNGSRILRGRLELPPVPLASCAGWIVVYAAELSDDKYDGWRNAPCPAASDGESGESGEPAVTTGSDGTGTGWPTYPERERPTRFLPLPLHELPFLRTDSGADAGIGSLDLTSFSIARPDASGWAAVTFTTAAAVDPTALLYFQLQVNVIPETQPRYAEQWAMRISGSAWSFVHDSDFSPDDGNPYVRTSQSTAAASSFSFEIRLTPEVRNQVMWLEASASADEYTDNLPGDAVEAAGGETFDGQEATPAVVFGASDLIDDQAYRVMIP